MELSHANSDFSRRSYVWGLPALAAPADKKIDFARDVQPIFQRRCAVCHGPGSICRGCGSTTAIPRNV